MLCGVHFMAETTKILAPHVKVLIPDARAGCSLADAITAADVRALRARHPGAPVVSYVNTTAAVKAASDVCCTSSNAAQIVAAMPGDTVIMTPDQYLAQNVAKQVPHKRIVWWEGSCIVHERFTAADLRRFQAHYFRASPLAFLRYRAQLAARYFIEPKIRAWSQAIGLFPLLRYLKRRVVGAPRTS